MDRLRIGVTDPEKGPAAVARLAREGVEHSKMRTTPDLETFLVVGDEAKRQGLPFAAHAVAAPEELLRAGLRNVEHFLAFHALAERSKSGMFCFRKWLIPDCSCQTQG